MTMSQHAAGVGARLPVAAIIGTGFIGPVHLEGLRRAGVAVRGVLGSSLAKSQQAAATWGLERSYASLDELLADGAVTSVHVTSPNEHHVEQVKRCLAAGKHVLCEKPLAMTAEQARTLVERAAESGLACGVAYNCRYYPLVQEAAARRASGSLGRLLHVQGSYVQDWLLHATDFNWRVLAEAGGELRAIADIGTHWLDLVQFVAGERIVAVCAQLQIVHPERLRPTGGTETFTGSAGRGESVVRVPVAIKTEDAGAVLLQFQSGAIGSLWVSQTTAGRKNCLRFELAGSAGSVAWNSESPNQLWLGQRDRANELLIRDPALLGPDSRRYASYPGGHNEGYPDTFKQLFRAFYGLVETSQGSTMASSDASSKAAAQSSSLYPTFADGAWELELCDAILRSHRQRSWVEVRQE